MNDTKPTERTTLIPHDDIIEIQRLRNRGISFHEIAEAFGVSVSYIRGVCAKPFKMS